MNEARTCGKCTYYCIGKCSLRDKVTSPLSPVCPNVQYISPEDFKHCCLFCKHIRGVDNRNSMCKLTGEVFPKKEYGKKVCDSWLYAYAL